VLYLIAGALSLPLRNLARSAVTSGEECSTIPIHPPPYRAVSLAYRRCSGGSPAAIRSAASLPAWRFFRSRIVMNGTPSARALSFTRSLLLFSAIAARAGDAPEA